MRLNSARRASLLQDALTLGTEKDHRLRVKDGGFRVWFVGKDGWWRVVDVLWGPLA